MLSVFDISNKNKGCCYFVIVYRAVSNSFSVAECRFSANRQAVLSDSCRSYTVRTYNFFRLNVKIQAVKRGYKNRGMGTPLMIQLLIFYYFPGLVFHNNIWGMGEPGRFTAAAMAFILNYACYFSEIYRGGIQSIPFGQTEAGQVLGLSKRQIFFKVTLLQMIKRIVPPMSNEIITLVKDTSLARIIALQELIWAGEAFLKGSQGISGQIWPLFFTGVYYLLFSGILTVLFNKIEKKLSYFKA